MSNESTEAEVLEKFTSTPGGDIFQLVADLGISLVKDPNLGGKSGQIEFSDGKYTISINAFEHPRRQAFTTAHEVAHYVLHRDLLQKTGSLNRHTDTLFGDPKDNEIAPFSEAHEVQANKFAARLLMPARLVRSLFRNGTTEVDKLSKKFGVSQAAMEIRLKNLGLK